MTLTHTACSSLGSSLSPSSSSSSTGAKSLSLAVTPRLTLTLCAGMLGLGLLLGGCSSSDSSSVSNLDNATQKRAQVEKSTSATSTNQTKAAPEASANKQQLPEYTHEFGLVLQDPTLAFGSPEIALRLAKAQKLEYVGPYTPYTGSDARIYGSPANGCIDGAKMLSDVGEDFQLQRWGDDRNFAHPMMLQYLQDLRARAEAAGLPPLLIGDLSRAYGGPYGKPSLHASHNTGLDVDLPFDFASPRKSAKELRNPKENYLVTGQNVNDSFTPEMATYIKTAASDPRVERVFVAPMIKKHMCDLYEGTPYDGFLHKLRPWFGHRAHMHVRLYCPLDSADCVKPKPIPEGTGCGYEVASWFLPPAKPTTTTKPKPKPEKVLPEKCKLVLSKYDAK